MPRRFSVDEYHRMAEAGIFAPGERVELIEGEIIAMASIGSRHAGTVNRLTRLFVPGVGDRALVTVQNPVRLSDLSEPEPDVTLVRPRADDYTTAHPQPGDTLLIIEVADTSAGFDRGRKAPLYARTGVPEYWLIDIDQDHIEVYRAPGRAGYDDVRTYRRGDTLQPLAFPDLAVPAAAILT